MGIGNYWECVLPAGSNMPPLQAILDRGAILDHRVIAGWRWPGAVSGEDAEFVCRGLPDGEIRAHLHLVKPHSRPSFYLHSAFPLPAAGVVHRLRLEAVEADEWGLEAFLTASIDDGPSVTFFDDEYVFNKQHYVVGKEFAFALGGFSLDMKAVHPPPLRVTNADLARHIAGEDWPGDEPIEVDMDRAKILLRGESGAKDQYGFQGFVAGVRNAKFMDWPFSCFRTAVAELPNETDFLVDIFVAEERLPSEDRPTDGTLVGGSLWLHGHLVTTAE